MGYVRPCLKIYQNKQRKWAWEKEGGLGNKGRECDLGHGSLYVNK